MSKEANAEGNARVRVALNENIGVGDRKPGFSSMVSDFSTGFSCTFLAFMASFDRFGSVGDVCG
jgi:hypothetical protein